MATEEHWVTVRYGDAFPEKQGCIRAMGIPGFPQQTISNQDYYIALWSVFPLNKLPHEADLNNISVF